MAIIIIIEVWGLSFSECPPTLETGPDYQRVSAAQGFQNESSPSLPSQTQVCRTVKFNNKNKRNNNNKSSLKCEIQKSITKMVQKMYAFGILFLAVVCLKTGFALDCYECNSHNDTRCSQDTLPDEMVKSCPKETKEGKPYILCRKIKQIIDFEVNGLPPDNRVIRSCGWDDSTYKNRCYHRSGFGGRQEVCACEGDKCNSSSSLLGSATLLMSLLALLKLSNRC
ncbi:PREDICTED: uncharacterized protein LOC108566997 [Nicrophorus vespilloides]|uniref:Uncharacterized protein LOC108566997 n=1 Tax=Nicrophorus vespilloides TaxID=110193 RepID=A0ABM1N758_NICVS|nr:PREDICTED: uncharacterized protein LOC108566997 [Nicrophorus vespilloides]